MSPLMILNDFSKGKDKKKLKLIVITVMLFCFFSFFSQNTDKSSDCKFSTMNKLMKIKVTPSSAHQIPDLGPPSLYSTRDLFFSCQKPFSPQSCLA